MNAAIGIITICLGKLDLISTMVITNNSNITLYWTACKINLNNVPFDVSAARAGSVDSASTVDSVPGAGVDSLMSALSLSQENSFSIDL